MCGGRLWISGRSRRDQLTPFFLYGDGSKLTAEIHQLGEGWSAQMFFFRNLLMDVGLFGELGLFGSVPAMLAACA